MSIMVKTANLVAKDPIKIRANFAAWKIQGLTAAFVRDRQQAIAVALDH